MPDKREIVLVGPLKPVVVKGLDAICTVHRAAETQDQDTFFKAHSDVHAIACSDTAYRIPGTLMAHFPKLEIVSSFGVGYDHMDVKYASTHNVVLTNTP
ncbi:MAG: 2-hydroxyacid dehydrogenase, partial [Xanthobacteraceae bacterium]